MAIFIAITLVLWPCHQILLRKAQVASTVPEAPYDPVYDPVRQRPESLASKSGQGCTSRLQRSNSGRRGKRRNKDQRMPAVGAKSGGSATRSNEDLSNIEPGNKLQPPRFSGEEERRVPTDNKGPSTRDTSNRPPGNHLRSSRSFSDDSSRLSPSNSRDYPHGFRGDKGRRHGKGKGRADQRMPGEERLFSVPPVGAKSGGSATRNNDDIDPKDLGEHHSTSTTQNPFNFMKTNPGDGLQAEGTKSGESATRNNDDIDPKDLGNHHSTSTIQNSSISPIKPPVIIESSSIGPTKPSVIEPGDGLQPPRSSGEEERRVPTDNKGPPTGDSSDRPPGPSNCPPRNQVPMPRRPPQSERRPSGPPSGPPSGRPSGWPSGWPPSSPVSDSDWENMYLVDDLDMNSSKIWRL